MSYSPLLQKLIDALRCLPGVGPKSAQRMAFQLLERNRQGALVLSEALQAAVEGIGHCERCRMLTEGKLCEICVNSKRDPAVVCVVETPADVYAIEGATGYRGQARSGGTPERHMHQCLQSKRLANACRSPSRARVACGKMTACLRTAIGVCHGRTSHKKENSKKTQ